MREIEQLSSEQILEKLERLEAGHSMTSESFYRLYLTAQAGSTDEEMDWAELYEAAIRRKLVPPPDLSALPRPEGTFPEIKVVRLTPELIREELARLEAKHGISSAELHERYLAPQHCHSPEEMEWEWLYDAAVELGLLTPTASA